MRYSRSNLLQMKDYHLVIDEQITLANDIEKPFDRIRAIDKINVQADGYYDPETLHLTVNFHIFGNIVVGCDVTGEDVTLPIDTTSDVTYSFDRKEEDIDIVKSEGEYINLLPTVFQLILLEIPIKVVKPGVINYPKGDGWQVISEQDFEKNRNHVDPRWEILKDYKPQ